jgi:two-component system chemotaxis response regulator CheB
MGLLASSGGINALSKILSALPGHFPAALVVVQHTWPRAKSHLAEILARRTELRVKEAQERDRLLAGWVFVAPPDKHVVVNPDDTLSLCQTGRVRHVRPSGDVLFASMAVSCQERAVVVVLSGCDDDGATGAKLVKAMGGMVIAQDEVSSERFDMPRAAIATGAVDYVLPLTQIATYLGYLAHEAGGKGCRNPSHSSECKGDCRRAVQPNGQGSHGCIRMAVPQRVRREARTPARSTQVDPQSSSICPDEMEKSS